MSVKIYVASSWRNEQQPAVVDILRAAGHEVYDFRNPREGDKGFRWSDIDPDWQDWSAKRYRDCLSHPIAEAGFMSDMDAMKWADVFVGVMPFGRSASLEMGWAAGHGKKTILLLEESEPELMVKMLDHICCDMDEVLEAIESEERSGLDMAVIKFAQTMQFKLDKNKYKPCEKMNPDGRGRTWDTCDFWWLLSRLEDETLELREELEAEIRGEPIDFNKVMKESADVGNFGMMIHDNASNQKSEGGG